MSDLLEKCAWIEALWGINVGTDRQGVREVEESRERESREAERERGERVRWERKRERERGREKELLHSCILIHC